MTVAFLIEHSFTLMETDPFTFQWMTWRRDPEVKFGISLNFDESNDKVEVAGIADESLAGEKNRRLSTFPSTRGCTLKTGDIIEAVNMETDIEEIQRELRTALRVQLSVARTKNFNVPEPPNAMEPQWIRAPRIGFKCVLAFEVMEY